MSARRLAVQRVRVERMPGFPVQGFEIPAIKEEAPETRPAGPDEGEDGKKAAGRLAAGVSVVHGPNASGKTTLAQAIRSALWPTTAPKGAAVHLTLHDGEETWSAEHDGGTTRWSRGASAAEPPNLPGEDTAKRYVLSLHELLAAGSGEDLFARAVLRESTGGYNLMEAAQTCGFSAKPPRRHNDKKKLDHAATVKRGVLAQQRQILDEEAHLASLREEHEAARVADRRSEMLRLAIEHAEAAGLRSEADKKLELLPSALQHAHGDETQQLDELEQELKEHEKEIEASQESIQETENESSKLALDDRAISGPLLDGLKADIRLLQETTQETRQEEKRLAEVKEREQAARGSLGGQIAQETLARLDAKQWSHIARFAKLWEKHDQESERLEVEARRLDPGPHMDPNVLHTGAEALRNHLRQPGSVKQHGRPPLLITATIGTATSIVSAALVHIAFLLPAILMIGIAAWSLTRTRETGADNQYSWQQAYETTDLPSPARWDERNVRIRLREIEAEIAKNEIHRRDQQRLGEIHREQARLEENKKRLLEQRDKIEQAFGPAPGDDPRTLHWVVERSLDWRRAHDEVQEAEARLHALRTRKTQTLEQLTKRLQPYGHHEIEDTNHAAACVKDLESRVWRHRELTTDLEHAHKALEKARKDQQERTARHRAIFDRFQVPHDEPETLRALLSRHDEYASARQQAEKAKLNQENALGRLRRHSLHGARIEKTPLDVLQQEHETARLQAERSGKLYTQIVEIEKNVRDAKLDTKVQQALRAHEEAHENLKQALAQDSATIVGHLLATRIHEKSRDRDRPPVFHRARELLLGFTQGRYRLEFDDQDPPTFKARDSTTQRYHDLQELSSATRLHLLLAVRIAFVEHQERGLRLPIILDETLATSDDLRAGALIDAVIALAKTGRQVIYLTAQGDEVAKWRDRLKDSGVPYAIIDLARERGLSQSLEVPDLEPLTVTQVEIPGPAGATHASYAEPLQVPPFDPRAGAGGAHLWYFVEDVELLHRLLSEGITTYGQLEALLQEAIPVAQTDDDERSIRRVQALAVAAGAYAKAWRVGRGKRVDRGVLDASGAVSGKFIDRLSEIAHECDGDAQRLLEAVDRKEAPGFRANKRDQLEAYLEEHGHLDPRERLGAQELRIRSLAAVAEEIKDHTLVKADVDDLLERLTQKRWLRAVA